MTASFQIPDALLHQADAVAQAKGLSRDEIVVTALTQYLDASPKANTVTAQLDALYSSETSTLEPSLARDSISNDL